MAGKAEQDKEREMLKNKWVDCDRLFTKWNGEPMNNQTPYGWLKDFCEKNNMRFCDVHSMRHFNASVLINSGVDAAAVSSALGHSCVGTTTNIYYHVFQEAQVRVSEAITAALDFKKSPSELSKVS